MLTQERADILTDILNADETRAEALLDLEPEEALKQINALGNDFTLDELHEYGKVLEAASKQGELDAESLDDVAGGVHHGHHRHHHPRAWGNRGHWGPKRSPWHK
ncbi:MAG: hypothetical protein FWG14_03900 [Peptococcaceae bacterium]|nr:hypothetical protein [Peptococcaceae bacterium]